MPISWQPSDIGADPADYAEGEVPVRDASGLFVPGAGADLSDAAPEQTGTPAPGTSVESSRADHVHGLGVLAVLTVLTFRSPDGSLWTFTVDNTGSLTGTALTARVTTGGDPRVTTSGDVRVPAGV